MKLRNIFPVAALLLTYAPMCSAEVVSDGKTVTSKNVSAPIKYESAKAMPLPTTNKPIPSQQDLILQGSKVRSVGPAQVFSGADGDGTFAPTRVPKSTAAQSQSGGGVGSQEYGSSGQPYTTSSVPSTIAQPYPRAGRLFFNINGNSYVCSASLIKTGVIVTAAHCVANFGKSQFYSGWTYIPGYTSGSAPYGTWTAAYATVLSSYYNGTDSCYVSGVVCQNDVAVIVVTPQSGAYPGKKTGYFGYGYNGYSYNGSSQALITQLGYPVALDGGEIMERTDSQGALNSTYSNNTIIGSLQTGGSSGGPWLVNIGKAAALGGSTGYGNANLHNIVVGVTSWGYTDTSSGGPKQQGASEFTSNNISVLVNYVCGKTPAACQ